MVDASRELEYALGDGVKRVEENEKTTVVLQRRCLRLKRDLPAGAKLAEADLEALRPAPAGSFAPYQWNELTGKTLKRAMQRGEAPMAGDLS
jgi:N-acetylneuraminate synthase